jgi:hypothetical protein
MVALSEVGTERESNGEAQSALYGCWYLNKAIFDGFIYRIYLHN